MGKIKIRLIETIVYDKDYDRDELIGLLIKSGDLPDDLTDAERDALTDAELADMTEENKPATVEEDMQSEGDVQGTLWSTMVVQN